MFTTRPSRMYRNRLRKNHYHNDVIIKKSKDSNYGMKICKTCGRKRHVYNVKGSEESILRRRKLHDLSK